MAGKIEGHGAGDDCRRGAPLASADDRANAGVEFIEVEGLHDKVVGAAVEAGDSRRHVVARRNDHYRHIPVLPPHRPQNVQPGSVGKTEVEQEHTVAIIGDRRGAIGAGAHPIDRHSGMGQGPVEASPDHQIVFDQENAHRSASPVRRKGPSILGLSMADDQIGSAGWRLPIRLGARKDL